MKIRLFIYLLIFFGTLSVGFVTTKFYYVVNITFKELGAGSMGMCDGTGVGGFATFKSYDGEYLTSSRIRFESANAARKCFDSITENQTVIENETLYDPNKTKIVGEKVVILDPNTSNASILSLDEAQIYGFDSTSLRHALIFEKQNRKY